MGGMEGFAARRRRGRRGRSADGDERPPFVPAAAPAEQDQRGVLLIPLSFKDLAGFGEDDHEEAFRVFARSCSAIAANAPPLRKGVAAAAALEAIAHAALDEKCLDATQARQFFETHFRPFRILEKNAAFLTGYYEPIVDGSLTASRDFTAPVLARPDNLDLIAPYPDRAAIEAGALAGHAAPVVWLRDCVEVFLVQVQGSARLRLANGKMARLVYAGRNGRSYTSIGRILIESGDIAEADMSLAVLKHWLRAHGQNPGDAGLTLMQRNPSYVFFTLEEDADPAGVPVGGQGIGLSALRSIAIDRAIWSYGLPFWIAAELPWQGPCVSRFRRLMIAQDTGSAITGPARADVFFGSGDDAGAQAGDIRHAGDMVVFLPAGKGQTGE